MLLFLINVRDNNSRRVESRYTGLCKKVPAKFGEESSVKADGLCIGCLSQWAEVGRENSNMQEFFCMTLYEGPQA